MQAGNQTRQALSVLLCAFAFSMSATAADSVAEMKARQQAERAACVSGKSGQVLSACLKEVDAAYAEVRRGNMEGGSAASAQNAVKRCEPLSGAERESCLARMQGKGTTSGTVKDGGVLRELVTIEPASPAARNAAEPSTSASGAAPAPPKN